MAFRSILGKSKYCLSSFPYCSLSIVVLTIFAYHVNCIKDSSRLPLSSQKMASFAQHHKVNSNHYYFPISHHHKAVRSNHIIARGPSKSHKSKETSHGYETEHHKKDVDSTLDDFLGTMGPHLFLIPFVLKALPFAIPALPLSYILSRYAPANIPELITQLMEFANQINESMQGVTTGGNEG